jgi:hypothetical protein
VGKTSQSGPVVVLLVPPYFFAHFHFYQRKLTALREYGLSSRIVAFVPTEIFNKNQSKYSDIRESGDVELVLVNGRFSKAIAIFKYFSALLKAKEKVVVHVLRETAIPIILLRMLGRHHDRLKFVQEFEGDNRSELVYREEFSEYPRPPEYPKKLINILKFSVLAIIDNVQAKFSDGLILMSLEHAKLWDFRVGISKEKLIMPTLPEKSRIFFDSKSRQEIRKNLGFDSNIVFLYAGNVVAPWQRLGAMCKLFKMIVDRNSSARFIMLLRTDDFELAKKEIMKSGIEEFVVIESADHQDVYKYLSASDIGFFLRHNHTMNYVVTSGKLGEYLASGMKILTTGANTESLNEFIRRSGQGCFIDDQLTLTDEVLKCLDLIRLDEEYESGRQELSKKYYLENDMDGLLSQDYPIFVSSLL